MATLEISAQRQFSHTGDLSGYQVANNDPRRDDFDWDSVRVDLSRCEFVRPAGVLWCTIYPLLVAEMGDPVRVDGSSSTVDSHLSQARSRVVRRSDRVPESRSISHAPPNLGRWQPSITRNTIRALYRRSKTWKIALVDPNLEKRNLSSTNLHGLTSLWYSRNLRTTLLSTLSPRSSTYGLVQYYDASDPTSSSYVLLQTVGSAYAHPLKRISSMQRGSR